MPDNRKKCVSGLCCHFSMGKQNCIIRWSLDMLMFPPEVFDFLFVFCIK